MYGKQPKPKSHLRVLADLRNEDGPADQLEIASEATLHRLSRSGASTVPGLRSTPAMLPSTSTPDGARPPSSHGLATRPTPNRFPDGTEDPDEDRASSSSNDEGEDGGEAGSDWGGMSLGGYGTEDEEERRASIWTGIRGAGMGGPGMTAASMSAGGKSPGSERGRMEIEVRLRVCVRSRERRADPFAARQTRRRRQAGTPRPDPARERVRSVS